MYTFTTRNFLFPFEGRNSIKTAFEMYTTFVILTCVVIEEMAFGHPHPIGLVLQKTI